MPELSFYALRHSNASLMINLGDDIKAISYLLEHCNIGITGKANSYIFIEYKAIIAKLNGTKNCAVPLSFFSFMID